MTAPMPHGEATRLAALHALSVLDTLPEEALDELTALAAQICQTPMAFIGLIDEGRQWFKSAVGWAVAEISRDAAFCAHTILGPGLLVVRDARSDERFATSPLVNAHPGVRFYAGVPLVTPEGHAIGTLCVLDDRPRDLSEGQALALRVLSRQVVAQLRLRRGRLDPGRVDSGETREATESRRVVEELRLSERRHRSLVQATASAVWSTPATGEVVSEQPAWASFTGQAFEQYRGWGWLDAIHPDDREKSARAWKQAVANHTFHQVLQRVRRRDGEYRHMMVRSVPVVEDDGSIREWVGSLTDVTDVKRAEEELRQTEDLIRLAIQGTHVGIVENTMPDGDIRRGKVRLINVLELLGRPPATSPIDYADWDLLIHPDDQDRLMQAWLDLMAGETPMYEVEYRMRHADGSYRWLLSRGIISRDERGRPGRAWGSCIDITDRKRVEDELRRANDRLGLAVRGSNVGIYQVEMADGDYWHGSGHLVNVWEQLGYDPSEVRPGYAAWMDVLHPDDRDRVTRALLGYLAGEAKDYEIEYRCRHKDGSYRWMLSRGIALRDAGGKAIHFAGSRIDVTEIKRVGEELRVSRERLDLILRSIKVGLWDNELPFGVLNWDDGLKELFGLPTDAVITVEQFLGMMHPDDRERNRLALERVLEQRDDYDLEYRIVLGDGRVRWIRGIGRVFLDAAGRPSRFAGIGLDETTRKQAEEALRESEERFRTLAEALPHMVWTAEPDGAHDYFNARNTEYTGLDAVQLRGWEWRPTVHPDDLPQCLELWGRSVATGEPYEIEYRLRRADGAFRWHLARAIALRDDAGRITKWFGSCIDIDDQKRAEEAMRQAKEAAEAASRSKSEFLANVSHEIRTPMNAVLGMTELALDTPLTAEQRNYLTIVKSSADALMNVINDLLDFSKIEAGKLELDPADFSLRRVLGDTLRALALRAHKQGLELICRIQDEVPDGLIGDAGRLRQVLLNIIGNAIKFTDQGEVVVRVEAKSALKETGPIPSGQGFPTLQVLHFSVSDTGVGIPLNKQRKIFQAFEQEDNSTTRKYGGTGLGLSIASRLVAMMGGQIEVESTPGRGSTFQFAAHFGLQPHQPEHPSEPPLADLRDLRILVVDDNATNRQILEEWLRGWHTDPLAVADGLKALDALWRAAASGSPFALILLDARMPGTDGLAVAASILQSRELSSTRIILLTSDDLRGEFARYRELGITACAMKPLQQEELLEIIYRVLSRRGPAGTAAENDELFPASPTPVPMTLAAPARRLRVLVAEDNPFNQQLVEHLLHRQGYDVELAGDGREAMAALERQSFDLMLLDVHMPELDGFQVVEGLRRRERSTGDHLPVVALTARAMKDDRERCLKSGMDEYLAKPIRAADLFSVMARVLAGRPDVEPAPAVSVPLDGLLDPGALLAACDNDATLLAKLCRVFRADAAASLARIHDGVREQDPSRLREAAHRLLGPLSAFSPEAAKSAAILEEMGASGLLDGATATLESLTQMVGRLNTALEALSIEQLQRQDGGDESP